MRETRSITVVTVEYSDKGTRTFWPSSDSGPEERQRLFETLDEAIRPATAAQALQRAEDAMRDACHMAGCDYPDFTMSSIRDAILGFDPDL